MLMNIWDRGAIIVKFHEKYIMKKFGPKNLKP
jgi:hypothetical protein